MDELEEIRKRKMEEMLKKMEYPDKPVKLNEGNFDEKISKYPLVLVDFWSKWCPPCRLIAPVIDELAKELKGKVVFGKLNVDENRNLAARFRIMAIPTLLLFRNGELVDQMVGAIPKQKILEVIKKYL